MGVGVLAFAGLIAVGGCGGGDAPAVAGGDADTVASGNAEVGGGDAVQRFGARVPAEVLVRRGACPFECCIYREWRAASAIPVMRAERDVGAPLLTMASGETFRADSGNVHITGIAIVVINDSVGDPPYWSFSPGDTVVVLDHVGEGHFNVWHDGEVKEAEGFWVEGRQPVVAELLGRYATEWWVHVTTEDGRTGWIRADVAESIMGADACG